MGELVFMLATPEGDVVAASHGLIGHIQSIPFIVRAIAELDFEDDPKIRDGDISLDPRFLQANNVLDGAILGIPDSELGFESPSGAHPVHQIQHGRVVHDRCRRDQYA